MTPVLTRALGALLLFLGLTGAALAQQAQPPAYAAIPVHGRYTGTNSEDNSWLRLLTLTSWPRIRLG